jgi:hypothetical protein
VGPGVEGEVNALRHAITRQTRRATSHLIRHNRLGGHISSRNHTNVHHSHVHIGHRRGASSRIASLAHSSHPQRLTQRRPHRRRHLGRVRRIERELARRRRLARRRSGGVLLRCGRTSRGRHGRGSAREKSVQVGEDAQQVRACGGSERRAVRACRDLRDDSGPQERRGVVEQQRAERGRRLVLSRV